MTDVLIGRESEIETHKGWGRAQKRERHGRQRLESYIY